MRDLAFVLMFAAMLPAILLSPCMGVLVWVWTAMLSPNEILFGFGAGIQMNRIAAVLTVISLLASQDKKRAYLDPLVVLLLLLTVVGTLSWAASIIPSDDGDFLYQKLLKEVALVVAITVAVSTRHRMHLLVLTVCAGFGFIGVKEGLIFLLTAGGHKIEGVLSIGDNNSLATALLMVVPFMYYASRYSAHKFVRIGLLGAAALCLVTVVATYSRGGFVGLLVLGGFMVKNSRNKVSSLILVAVAAGLIFTLAPESWFERLSSIKEADADASFIGRVNAWKVSVIVALDRPLTGGGFHSIQRYLVWQAYKPGIGLLDFIPTPPADDFPRAAHSMYFEILGDLGFPGIILFVATLAVAFWQCRGIVRMCRPHPELTWAADLGRMMQISLVVYAVTAALLSMGYFEFYYIVLAMVSRTRRTARLAIAAKAGGGAGAGARPARAQDARRPVPAYARQANPG